jgi:hypothetical protein
MFNSRVQVGDIKPLGPVWPQRSIDKVKRRDNEPKRDDEQRNRQSHDEDDDKDGHAFDDYA